MITENEMLPLYHWLRDNETTFIERIYKSNERSIRVRIEPPFTHRVDRDTFIIDLPTPSTVRHSITAERLNDDGTPMLDNPVTMKRDVIPELINETVAMMTAAGLTNIVVYPAEICHYRVPPDVDDFRERHYDFENPEWVYANTECDDDVDYYNQYYSIWDKADIDDTAYFWAQDPTNT